MSARDETTTLPAAFDDVVALISAALAFKGGPCSAKSVRRACYDVMLHVRGFEAIGEFALYEFAGAPMPAGYWTFDRCLADALKYQTRADWKNASCSAYAAAQRNDWLEQCCAHMNRVLQSWTLEACMADALKYQTRKQWEKASSGYAAAKRHKWLEQCCAHMETKKRLPNGFWTLEACMADALKYQTRKQWEKAPGGAYGAARRNGWLAECCAHMETKKKLPAGFWTLERCLADARRYQTPSQWKKASSGYAAAKRHKWLEQCCAHMETKKRLPNGFWTLERCLADARQYQTRAEWRNASCSAYDAAKRHKWLEQCCAHMTKRDGGGAK